MKKAISEKNIQISISVPQNVVKAVDRMAKLENRNRSNYISNILASLAKLKK